MQQSHDKEPEELPRPGIPSWEELRQRAYRLLQSRVARDRQPADWEDMAQEVVLRVIKALADTAVDVSRFDAWFFTVVRNVTTDAWRAQYGRNGERTYVAWTETDAAEDTRLVTELAQLATTHDLHKALAKLPEDQRRAVILTYWHGLMSREIGASEGVSPSTVRGRVMRALTTLREHFKKA